MERFIFVYLFISFINKLMYKFLFGHCKTMNFCFIINGCQLYFIIFCLLCDSAEKTTCLHVTARTQLHRAQQTGGLSAY